MFLGGARETPPQVCFYDCFLNISPSQPRWKDLQSLQYHHGRRHLGPPARHGTDGPSGWHCASNPHRRFVLRHSPPAALRKVCHDCWTALFDGPLSQHFTTQVRYTHNHKYTDTVIYIKISKVLHVSQKHSTRKSRKTTSASLPGHTYENTYGIIEQHLDPSPKPQTHNSLQAGIQNLQSLWNLRDHSTQPVWQNY